MIDPDREILKQLLQEELRPIQSAKKTKPGKDTAPGMDHWSTAVLLERAAYLRKLARAGDGQASETLHEYPDHAVMLSVRERDGVAELHENFADMFHVLEGRATLVTGGVVLDEKRVGPGEIRGSSIAGGNRQDLRPGDLAHVPAGMPHQVIVPGDRTFASLVIKIHTPS